MDIEIDHDSHENLPDQIAGQLREGIENGTLSGRLPSETTLVQMTGVSRVTVRRAMDVLVAEGLIVRRQGRGTFVK